LGIPKTELEVWDTWEAPCNSIVFGQFRWEPQLDRFIRIPIAFEERAQTRHVDLLGLSQVKEVLRERVAESEKFSVTAHGGSLHLFFHSE